MEAYRIQYAHFTINFPTKTMMDKKNLLTFANETHLIAYKLQSSVNASILQPNIHIYIYLPRLPTSKATGLLLTTSASSTSAQTFLTL